ncbi:oligosaccharyl transferase, archaeosortase A system-associated [Halobacteriaceae archaeon GCM10025711]
MGRPRPPRLGYPVAVLGIIVVGAGLVSVVLPGLFKLVMTNVNRFVLLGTSAATATIGEARPLIDTAGPLPTLLSRASNALMQQYGLAYFSALLAALVIVYRSLRHDEHDGARLLVVVWFAFITMAAFTQLRFNYYLAVPVAVLNGFLIWWVLALVDVDAVTGYRDIESSQVMVVLMVVLVVVVPLAVGVSSANARIPTAMQSTNNVGPGSVTSWDGSLVWMQNNTPEEGNFGGAGNDMEYYGTFERTEDFEYPEGSYGVMSWWDYGHWITVRGERIPVANPFQQHAREAANYLLAQDEATANQVLADLGDEGDQTRYVMVDWQMITPGSKFGAPSAFQNQNNLSLYDYRKPYFSPNQRGQFRNQFYVRGQPYYNSTMVRLYRYHGSAQNPAPVVVDWDQEQQFTGGSYYIKQQGTDTQALRQFDNMTAAREYVQRDQTSQIGGYGPYPLERVPAMEHYRLVKASAAQAPGQLILQRELQNTPSFVKTFERVPGATVEGTAPANTEVRASVEMSVPSRNSTFTYTQYAQTGEDGTFTMTLPYSTTGYENWGPEQGYTNVSVRATGQYEFSTTVTDDQNLTAAYWNASADVTEAQVIGQDDATTSVELTKASETPPPDGAQNQTNTDSNQTNATGNTTNSSALPAPSTSPGGQDDGSATDSAATSPSLDAAAAVARGA